MSHKKGFTLLEILLVVGIIAILAGIVIIAINPGKQLATVRNTERAANLKEINNAIQQYYIDHSSYPASIPNSLEEICDTGATTTPHSIDCTGLVDLSILVPTYLVAIPSDPQGSFAFLDKIIPKAFAASNGNGYLIGKDDNNKISLVAPKSELSADIVYGSVAPGPVFSLVSKSTSKTTLSDNGISTSTLTATFVYSVLAQGQDVVMGDVASTTNPFATSSSFGVYVNGLASTSVPIIVTFSTPSSGITLVSPNSFILSKGNKVEITVQARVIVAGAFPGDSYAIQTTNLLGKNFMQTLTSWRTNGIAMP